MLRCWTYFSSVPRYPHPSRSLSSWSWLTTGKPAALESPRTAERVARSLAVLQGCERVALFPSTLHLFFDLFEVLRHEGIRLYVDGGAYPIVRWGAERAAARGVLLRTIPHYDPIVAQAMVEKDCASGLRPVILADGYCAHCGRTAPLKQFLSSVVPDNGYVVLDDTQALGVFGEAPDQANPYGRGGGGSLRLHDIHSPAVLVGSSLAKGFGAPLAALGGTHSSSVKSWPEAKRASIAVPLRSLRCAPPSMPWHSTGHAATRCVAISLNL